VPCRAPTPPRTLPAIEIGDLDWDRVASRADPREVRRRTPSAVLQIERLLDRPEPPKFLFDRFRESPADRAIKIESLDESQSFWFIGDLHGDLLALEAAIALAERERTKDGLAPAFVFLGDAFDDGGHPAETLTRLYELIHEHPDRVCLIAGNHDEALSRSECFESSVQPSDFTDLLNRSPEDQWLVRSAVVAIRLFMKAARALFFPDGLLVAHGGFPLTDLHEKLRQSACWNDPACLQDFIWTRAHPTARRKLPNRHARGAQFGHEDFADFCAVATSLGRPISHMIRGHDHVEERFAIYEVDPRHPILTTVALSRRLDREYSGPYVRAPTVARYVEGALPQVYKMAIPPEIVRAIYPETPHADSRASEGDQP
jgi:hypothetical protein